MSNPSIATPESFAREVVGRLREAGYEALWAGGCVRDRLLGREPKDFDVATSAQPDQIRELFGHRRTLAIGAAFGVISVLQPGGGMVEVATFRQDAQYSDGRHPDSVTFSTAEEDAQRRDFTINGLFYDPLEDRVVDYVGGQRDLDARLIRAIRDPHERIAEDKLRMLRAVRFAATLQFSLDPETRDAVRERAEEVVVVSGERIAAELRRMLAHPTRRRAVEMLADTGLLAVLVPESCVKGEQGAFWNRCLAILEELGEAEFPAGLAILLDGICDSQQDIGTIGRRWRLSNEEIARTRGCLDHQGVLRRANELAWSQVQPILTGRYIDEQLRVAAAVAAVDQSGQEDVAWCRVQLDLPPEQLDPLPLVTGSDLIDAGLRPGPEFKKLLQTLRDAQLDGQLLDKDEALAMAARLLPP